MQQKKSVLLILLFITLATITKAQSFAAWEVGLMGGGAGYVGDLNQKKIVNISGVSAGLFVKRNFNSYMGLRLNYTYGQIKADDANSSNSQFKERNLRFKTPLNEASLILDFNFFDYKITGGNYHFTPYLYAGAAAVSFKPQAKYDGTKYDLTEFNTEGQVESYKNYALSIPYGAGIKYNYKDNWTVFSEIGYRTAFTDYLDDVSGVYPNLPAQIAATVSNPPINLSDPSLTKIGIPGTQRGDFRKRDTYLFVSVGISFTFVSSKCYSF